MQNPSSKKEIAETNIAESSSTEKALLKRRRESGMRNADAKGKQRLSGGRKKRRQRHAGRDFKYRKNFKCL